MSQFVPGPSGRSRSLLPLAGALTVGASALATYSLLIEPHRLDLTYPDIAVAGLPKSLEGLSILLLTDPHISRWGRREQHLLSLLQTVPAPDLLVWGGDFLQGDSGLPHAVEMVRRVAEWFPDVPAFAVHGNAEHKISPSDRAAFVQEIERLGVRYLVNDSTRISLRGEQVRIVGVDDPYYGFADLEAALQEREPVEQAAFTILLSHSPQTATQAARMGIPLMLSGHTHGGQIRLPFIGPLKTQNPLARRFDCGMWDRSDLTNVLGRDPGGDLTVYISRGIGVANVPRIPWLAPRLLCRPEIARLTLRCSNRISTSTHPPVPSLASEGGGE